ncbi:MULTISPECIES: 3,4-dihydroxy-2-butanone-4-phosphate synthase [Vibrio]|uniref:3,4-dihydroxy-2-butanone 4-phosphate synthase n=1 Tax=Vibrio jasicida TaxID=766224 RepID=A0AAU9QTH8_9VIBR|nr:MULTISPECIES: 3,4-dihydroxy-2-butanone-4-phosphate synthase [Vibrio]KIP69432.1 3,4-dihydroxy-2-butanone 4-phosphate synthase [Vibrio harveyi]MCF6452667.1 3,4-dihydroxy-2-butanone-4-phosphate synthase [Vibrio sp. MMG023]PQJ71554.1 3,4-dihydroxy-2-butanone-4-phosphate synthase [Vibrio jasicida]UQA54289.1 3,4-dihydroxy-2-butanone-4-phosphate synthase [Vibrio sp. ED002]CAH1527581.1 3,4-dihydroxy-2-butanone-4-phosphate synthase [Vibrio jasicida]
MSSTSLLEEFGNPLQRVERAIEALKNGNGVLLMDDENRENEGDLIFSAQHLTDQQMALMIRECSGIVCLCLTQERANWLELPPMVEDNRSKNQTAFTVSIEAKQGVTTGVSAKDRVTTVKTAIYFDAQPDDLARPGHVFPLVAKTNGVLTRRGHTEGTIDLMYLANLVPSGVLCELTNSDGTMAKLPETIAFAKRHEMPVLTIEDIVEYRTGIDLRNEYESSPMNEVSLT